jgi:hypothetical protein
MVRRAALLLAMAGAAVAHADPSDPPREITSLDFSASFHRLATEAGATAEGEVDTRSDDARAIARILAGATADYVWGIGGDGNRGHVTLSGDASAEARTDPHAPLGAHAHGAFAFGYIPERRKTNVVDGWMLPGSLHADVDFAQLPAIDARRDLHRAAFSRRAFGLDLVLLRGSSARTRYDFAGMSFSRTYTEQVAAGVALAQRVGALDLSFVDACYLRWHPAPDLCVQFLDVHVDLVHSPKGADVFRLGLFDVRGIRLPGQVFAGASFGMAFASPDGGENLPSLDHAVGGVHLERTTGRLQLAARAENDFYLDIDGNLALEDAAHAEISWRARRTTFFARGFAARTRWWSAVFDRGHLATTGGAEVGAIRRAPLVEVEAAFGVARTYYDVLDGAAVATPGLAGSARLILRRGVKVAR